MSDTGISHVYLFAISQKGAKIGVRIGIVKGVRITFNAGC